MSDGFKLKYRLGPIEALLESALVRLESEFSLEQCDELRERMLPALEQWVIGVQMGATRALGSLTAEARTSAGEALLWVLTAALNERLILEVRMLEAGIDTKAPAAG